MGLNRAKNLLVLASAILFIASCGGGGDSTPQTIGLSAATVTPSEAQLSWTPSADSVIGYDLYRNGVAVWDTHLSGTSFTDRKLEPNSRYCYIVYAVSWIGITGKSNEACITTEGTAGWNIETIGNGSDPSLALDSSNQPHVSYRSSGSVVLAYKSGGVWQQDAINNNAGNYGDTSLRIDSQGANQLSYYDATNTNLMHASNLNGVWTSEIADTSGGYVNALILDSSNNAHIAFNSIEGTSSGVISYTTNVTGSWQKVRLAGYSNATISSAAIALDSNGVVHIVITTRGIDCYVHHFSNPGGNWQEEIIASDCNYGATIAIDSTDHLHIAYTSKFGLQHVYNSNGSWQSEQVDSFSWIGGNRVSMVIDSTDHLHIAYSDSNQDLKYITNLSGAWQNYFIDCIGNVGANPSIAIDANGRVSIAYEDTTNGTVKLAVSP
ncbi:MAG: fibronectin type III domain-containing protein [Gammaproteobacteria bacterium]